MGVLFWSDEGGLPLSLSTSASSTMKQLFVDRSSSSVPMGLFALAFFGGERTMKNPFGRRDYSREKIPYGYYNREQGQLLVLGMPGGHGMV